VQPEDFPEVLRLAQAGDEAAFTELFRATQPVVLRYLGSMAAPDLVEDVASDAWVSIVKTLESFRDDSFGNIQAWALTTARRRWIDEVRRRSRRTEVLSGTDTPIDIAADETVESAVEHRMSDAAAMALVRRLPPDQAEVVALRTISGLTVEQVAQIVGKRAGTVRVLSHRGLRKLAELLDEGVTESSPRSVEDVT